MKFFDDLPEIALKPTSRAKRLKLTVSSRGIRLSYPPKTSQRTIDIFLKQSYIWLTTTWQQQLSLHSQAQEDSLPESLRFAYSDHPYQIIYTHNLKNYVIDDLNHQIYICLDSSGFQLTQCIIEYAIKVLPTRLQQLAFKHGCRVDDIKIRYPKTRWGSCSSQQQIMLHAGLVLMPDRFADYVVLHELAHTKHMHHQLAFWELLDSFMPNAKQIQKQVKGFRLPTWWQPNL